MPVGSGPGPEFLAEKYVDLSGSHEVERASIKARSGGEKIRTREERVGAYMGRLEKISSDERGLERLSHKILDEFTIDSKDEETLTALAQGLYESEKKACDRTRTRW